MSQAELRALLVRMSENHSPSALQAIIEKQLGKVVAQKNALLSPEVRDGLRDSGVHGADFEEAIRVALREKEDAGGSNCTEVCYTKGTTCKHSHGDRVARLRNITTVAGLAELVNVPLKVMCNSGYGGDILMIEDVDEEEKTITFMLIQVKGGRTGIHDATSKNNQNSSMFHIATKLRHCRDSIKEALEETFKGWEAYGYKALWTTRELNVSATTRATDNGVIVKDASEIYNDVLTPPMKAYLDELFGDKAKTFGH